jgi:hypothetical protein
MEVIMEVRAAAALVDQVVVDQQLATKAAEVVQVLISQ